MPDVYLIIVVLLFLLAVCDLIVGVSNDAVNFLNSAIGSRVASRRTIMIVASLGILLGATFSSGMMEVARKGVFNPELFLFGDIMAVFLAVMLTDIILLDLFNTFGLPTSTTVSIVFELLGAAVAVAVLKALEAGAGFAGVAEAINGSGAIAIVSGIFLSVAIAFTVGAAVMLASRLLFTFQFRQSLGLLGSLWSGLALAGMTYFLLIKGAKGASFLPPEVPAWAAENTALALAVACAAWSAVSFALAKVLRVHVLRFVVLAGTFSLAMAFAGNDLVNFIGVPVAGFESFLAWRESGLAADAYSMEVLAEKLPTKTYLLVGAGVVMTATLWVSRKSRSVTETEVNLGRQSEGLERFSPNWLARFVVRAARSLGAGATAVVPDEWRDRAEERLASPPSTPTGEPAAAFDLVRAAVNLTVASALIALATSYRLPLSTTYVSFMVAMGTSLADGAWGRDSAVYRVAGVLNVIGGWLATAVIAFTVSATFAGAIHRFGLPAVVVLVIAAAGFLARTYGVHRRRAAEEARRAAERSGERVALDRARTETVAEAAASLAAMKDAWRHAIAGLGAEDRGSLAKAEAAVRAVRRKNDDFKYGFHTRLQRLDDESGSVGRLYLLLYDLEQDGLQSIELIVRACRDHVANSLPPPTDVQLRSLTEIEGELARYFDDVGAVLRGDAVEPMETVMAHKRRLLARLEACLDDEVERVRTQAGGARSSLLFFTLLLETKDLTAIAARFATVYRRSADDEPGASQGALAPPAPEGTAE